jgi:hypothetical protein
MEDIKAGKQTTTFLVYNVTDTDKQETKRKNRPNFKAGKKQNKSSSGPLWSIPKDRDTFKTNGNTP